MNIQELVKRAMEAMPTDATAERNLVKLTEETGELAALVFEQSIGERSAHSRLHESAEEVADIILAALMDCEFTGASPMTVEKALIKKLERQEDRKRDAEG